LSLTSELLSADDKLGTSATINNTQNPVWDEVFHFFLCHRIYPGRNDKLAIEIKDKNVAGSKLIGTLSIPWPDLLNAPNGILEPAGGFLLQHPTQGQRGILFMRLCFSRQDQNASGSLQPVVPKVYFDATSGNSIRFYQNAHNTMETVPHYYMPSGHVFPIHSCWTDIYTAIVEAQKFIFLTGWSVHPLTQLVRRGNAQCPPIGELLKAATARGVMVCCSAAPLPATLQSANRPTWAPHITLSHSLDPPVG
jgi:hypothetical protein